ncbi:MAG TPA: RNA polymerase Rpb4 family protein [archaeon]|nr:RNA polymerase Rpb4 family protein [archaeon]
MDVKDEQFVTAAEAKQALEKKSGERELGYEQKNALEYLKKFIKLSPAKAKELAAELKGIERLKERQVAAIVDYLPESEEELRLLFASEITALSEDEKKRVLAAVQKVA